MVYVIASTPAEEEMIRGEKDDILPLYLNVADVSAGIWFVHDGTS